MAREQLAAVARLRVVRHCRRRRPAAARYSGVTYAAAVVYACWHLKIRRQDLQAASVVAGAAYVTRYPVARYEERPPGEKMNGEKREPT